MAAHRRRARARRKRLRIRRASVGDAARIRDLDACIFPGPDQFSIRRYRYLLGSPHAVTYVAEFDNELVGSAVALIRRSHSGRLSGRIYSIGVASNQQRYGIGSRLLKRIEGDLRERGVERIILETRAHSDRARAFFSARGYLAIAALHRYYFDDDGVKMAKAGEISRKRILDAVTPRV
jgi:ribosomal protein S18 acetylase RimI-like enzyme